MPRVLLNKENNMPSYFTQWLVVQMHQQKVTQKELAELLNITRQGMRNKMETNHYSFDEFIKLAHYLKADEADLIKLTKV